MRIDKICLEEQFNYNDISESELKIIFEKRLEEAKEKYNTVDRKIFYPQYYLIFLHLQ